ncbi:S8 family serine peptidase [Streptomyces sp. P38-E01]|uniref:S8 family serine peptidase n=1 Tax=Streptomyces tardus TaxID=2780544 RepID=A0A949N6M5_9ACTN|nr:S8 family serine peptidase [Streptomyces tardus]MBU7596586.1 S8 family serine peptidase [Streptomyces tardus]
MRQLPSTRRTLIALAVALLLPTVTAPAAHADNRVGDQRYLDAMKAEEMWKVSQGEGVTIAVVTVHGRQSLPELEGRMLPTKRFDPSAESPASSYGDSMASLIAGTGAGGGIKGLAPKAKILPIDIAGKDAVAAYGHLPRAVDYAVDKGAKIITIPFSTPEAHLIPRKTQAAVHRAHRKGVLMFAASGDDGTEAFVENYPAVLPGVVRVGATDENGEQAEFSTSGSGLTLAAPGTGITTLDEDGSYQTGSGGTGSATALTSAAAALIWAENPQWTGNQVLRTMIHTADRSRSAPTERLGYGAIRPHKVLLDNEGNPGAPDTHPTFASYYARLDADAAEATADTKDTDATLLAGAGLVAGLLLAAATLYSRRRHRSPGAEPAGQIDELTVIELAPHPDAQDRART